jgi:hypothetical protein
VATSHADADHKDDAEESTEHAGEKVVSERVRPERGGNPA